MTQQLLQIAAKYEDARNRFKTLSEQIDDDTFNAKPSPDSWSVAECVVHLNKLSERYVPMFEQAFDKSAPKAEGPFKWGYFARKFIEMTQPEGRAVPTGSVYVVEPPADGGLHSKFDRKEVVGQFEEDMDRFIRVCKQAEGYDLARIKVPAPFLSFVRLPVGAVLEGLGGHAQRHVGQAERAVTSAEQ